MKKLMTLAALMLLIAGTARAQFIANVGLTSSSEYYTSAAGLKATYGPSLSEHIGVQYNIPVAGNFSIAPGVAFYHAKIKDADASVTGVLPVSATESMHGLEVPVEFYYGFDLAPDLCLSIFAGPSLVYNMKDVLKYTVGGTTLTYDYIAQGDYQPFDVAVGGGLAFDYASRFRIRLGYEYTLLNAAPAPEKSHTGSVLFSLGYIF